MIDWKRLYTDASIMLDKYQNEIVPGLREQLAEMNVNRHVVVNCKDCQSHEPCEVRNRVWCRTMGRYMKEDGFCSEGVMKDA